MTSSPDQATGTGPWRRSAVTLEYDVVIPTHARNPTLLLEAVDSVRRQTVPPRAILVVVDGDPDAAATVAAASPDITVLSHGRPRGEAAARQTGIDAATSEWVAFLDDDDLWALRKQERLAGYVAEHPDCAAVRAGYWMFSPAGEDVDGLFGQRVELRGSTLDELEERARAARALNDLDYLDIEGRSLPLMLEFNRGVIGTTMVRREVLQGLPVVPEGLRPGADFLLFCHVAAVTEWHLVRERLEYYRLHAGQDTRAGGGAARGILTAKRLAWEAHGAHNPRPLEGYGAIYAAETRQFVWAQVKARQIGEAWRVYRAALPILPLARHRLAAVVPEPMVWHGRRWLAKLRTAPAAMPTAPSW